MAPQVSICIVTWNNEETIQLCLESIHKYIPKDQIEVILCDNASQDQTLPIVNRFPWVKQIRNPSNKYYAKANNQCFEESKGQYILLLNPDICFLSNPLPYLIEEVQKSPQVFGATCQLIYSNEIIQRFCRRLPNTSSLLLEAWGRDKQGTSPLHQSWLLMDDWDFKGRRQILQAPGALLLLKSKVLKEIGGFDESFPLLFNDVDLCKRIHTLKGKLIYTDATKAIHYSEGSLKQIPIQRLKHFSESRETYFLKHGFLKDCFLQFLNPLKKAKPSNQIPKGKTLIIPSAPENFLIECCAHLESDSSHNVLLWNQEKSIPPSLSTIKKIKTHLKSPTFSYSSMDKKDFLKLKKDSYDSVVIPLNNWTGHGYWPLIDLVMKLEIPQIILYRPDKVFFKISSISSIKLLFIRSISFVVAAFNQFLTRIAPKGFL